MNQLTDAQAEDVEEELQRLTEDSLGWPHKEGVAPMTLGKHFTNG